MKTVMDEKVCARPSETEEARVFMDLVREISGEFYTYMHEERKEPDEPQTLLKRMIKLYDADWIGLIDFDLAVGAWSTQYFYNANTKSSSKTRIQEAESVEQAARWVEAIRNHQPIIIEDVETIKDDAPEEYEMYKRLNVQSVLAVPYRNCSCGLMVVRNPKRFKTCYEALNILSYIVTNELIALRRRRNIERKAVEYEPKNYDEVSIKLFGEMEIVGKGFTLEDADIPEPMKVIIAYMSENRNRSYGLMQLAELTGTTEAACKTLIYRFRTKWKNECNPDYQLICTSSGKGYRLNPDLKIVFDTDSAMELIKSIEDATTSKSKLELMKTFLTMYRGDYLLSVQEDYPFVEESRICHKQKFATKMDEFLRLLYDQHKYEALAGYAADILKILPASVDVYCWRVAAFKLLGKMDIANATLKTARRTLDEDERKLLEEKLNGVIYMEKKLADQDTHMEFSVYRGSAVGETAYDVRKVVYYPR